MTERDAKHLSATEMKILHLGIRLASLSARKGSQS